MKLTSIKIPDSVTTIEAHAFTDNELISMAIPNRFYSETDAIFGFKSDHFHDLNRTQLTKYYHGYYLVLVNMPKMISKMHFSNVKTILVPHDYEPLYDDMVKVIDATT